MHPKAIAAASDSEMCQAGSACCDSATGTPTEQQLLLVPVVNILRAPVCAPACAALPAMAVPAGTLLSSPHSRGEEFVSALQAWFDSGRLFSPCPSSQGRAGMHRAGAVPSECSPSPRAAQMAPTPHSLTCYSLPFEKKSEIKVLK